MLDPPPDGAIWNPAKHPAADIVPGYNPPRTPCEAPEKLTSPCCSCNAPPSSSCSIKRNVVWPSNPFPPATCRVWATSEIASDGSLTSHVVGSGAALTYCSSINAGLLCGNGFCDK